MKALREGDPVSDPVRVIKRARENVEDPALPAIRAAFDLSADEAVALVHAVDRWLEEKW